MKLSFSINGWNGYSWEDFVTAAQEARIGGIELHGIHTDDFTQKTGPFHRYNTAATVRGMFEKRLTIPCLDSVCDIADGNADNGNEIAECLRAAHDLNVPYVRVHAADGGADDVDAVIACLEQVEPEAERLGVTMLLETVGMFAATNRLRDVLNHFASDSLAALWDMHHTCRDGGEDAQTTITNLGAYVRHVHIKDSVVENGRVSYRLIGEGDLPIEEMMQALSSVNYDGFISLEWDPSWMLDMTDLDVILSHYENFMHRFQTPFEKAAPPLLQRDAYRPVPLEEGHAD